MSEAFFDTNILIDALGDNQAAWSELRRFTRHRISRITWIELMAGGPESASAETEDFLRLFEVTELDEQIARRSASLRQQRKSMRLPDAIILASAQVSGCILVTRNIKDFPARMPGIRVPYTI